ncbi:MAG: helix-turn-helix domain-containing protein [Deltaproteobacteria bacterium]|nr:helix-turn-helix domain-containing protein [Deltaproteobacteria bacterium]
MKLLSPVDLQALLTTDVDIVDVREPAEWLTGHVPGARLVPLAQLRADPRGALPRDNVVFICAKGKRSETAAEVAMQIGRAQVYSLSGGTDAWRAAGLPIVMPEAQRLARGEGEPVAPVAEPELDALVGANLHAERSARGLSLDDLARDSGVSRTLLGQIELGRTVPSIGVIWKIAQALGVPFSTLLASAAPRVGTTITEREQAKKLTSADGRFSSRALYPLGDAHAAEFYELWMAPHSREDAEPHRPGTRENLIVVSGRLELKVGNDSFQLGKGAAVNFSADQPHSYINRSGEECWMYLVMNYAGRK